MFEELIFNKLISGDIVSFKTKNGKLNNFEQLVSSINSIPKKQSTLLIGIDGCGGAGKVHSQIN